MCRFMKGCIQMRTAPTLDWPVDMVPVDIVARSIVALAAAEASCGRVFHMCHPDALRLPELWDWVARFGYPLEQLDYAAWRAQLLAVSEDNALFPLVPMFASDEAAMGSSMDMPTFVCDGTTELLTEVGERQIAPAAYPSVRALLSTAFSWFINCDFLEDPPSEADVFRLDLGGSL
eukprot:PLAT14038.4.p2 GENE.PLAT14038.4~~PLAT14038.4.p2  ORF type:complete len:176 (+),score=68.52 PLAT14038.4:485-1012(+)